MEIIVILFFALAYAVKGGALGYIKKIAKLKENKLVFDFLLDGKVLSTLMVLIFTAAIQPDLLIALFFAAAWLLAVSPSMGEEAGAVGHYKGAWGPYIEKGFGREYGIKKALQRGVFMGACFTLATGFTGFILTCALFPAAHFAGQSLYYTIHKKNDWRYAEPIVGACIGLGAALWLN